MPTPKRGSRLGAGPSHQKLLLAGLASELFRHGRIKTTEGKAKQLRPYAERLITKAKQGDLHARRQALAKLRDRDVVAYLFDDIGPRYADRNGGYTRMLKLGPRKGDNAPMVLVELTELGDSYGDEVIEEAKAGRSRGLFGRRRKRTGVEEVGAGTTLVDDLDLDDQDEEDEITDEDVAAAVAQATGQDVAAADDSADSPSSPDSADSADSPSSPSSADSPDEPEASDEAAEDDGDDEKKDA